MLPLCQRKGWNAFPRQGTKIYLQPYLRNNEQAVGSLSCLPADSYYRLSDLHDQTVFRFIRASKIRRSLSSFSTMPSNNSELTSTSPLFATLTNFGYLCSIRSASPRLK